MKNKYWFKGKKYGWGWYPASWQGWTILFVFILITVLNFLRIDINSHSVSDTLINFIPETFIATLILIFICYKTGEKPKLRWGK